MSFLFDYHIDYYSDSKNRTHLPFSAFALTQQGLEHKNLNIGNQDSGNIFLSKKILIGSVTDGCTSGNNLNGKSFNQTGAAIGGYLTVRLLRKLIIKKHIPLSRVIPEFEQELIFSLKRLLNTLNPWKFEKNEVLKNLFFSTIIFFVIMKEEYLIANCGDGDIFINDQHSDLNSESGKYFANNLIDIQRKKDGTYTIKPSLHIKCVSLGKTNEVNNVLIATDGFLDEEIIQNQAFRKFFINDTKKKFSNGFQDRRAEFRNEFLNPILNMKNGRMWPHDDATFISIQRVIK